jgi:hypothetical protein
VDLSKVNYIDRAGKGDLKGAFTTVRNQSGAFTICVSINRRVKALLIAVLSLADDHDPVRLSTGCMNSLVMPSKLSGAISWLNERSGGEGRFSTWSPLLLLPSMCVRLKREK